jgi:RNA polymerase sigma factor (sigma-70 family)
MACQGRSRMVVRQAIDHGTDMATTQISCPTTTAGCTEPCRREIAELMRHAADGDQASWDEIVARHSRLVWSITRRYRLGRADAADVFQTAWLRLVEHIDELADPRGVTMWLATTTRRECMRVLRAGRWQVPVDALPERPAGTPEVDELVLQAERDAMLHQAFGRLPRADQELLTLLVREPVPSYDEIAASLAIPRGSIGPTRRRCLERLRRECERQESGAGAPVDDAVAAFLADRR